MPDFNLNRPVAYGLRDCGAVGVIEWMEQRSGRLNERQLGKESESESGDYMDTHLDRFSSSNPDALKGRRTVMETSPKL
jgi:hypothetical protein